MRFERAHQVFALLNTHISYALVLFVLLLLLFVFFFGVFRVCCLFYLIKNQRFVAIVHFMWMSCSNSIFVCKCERGRECAQQRVIESYRFFYCLFFSALSSSFSSLAFIKPPWGDQTKMRKRSKSNTQNTVCDSGTILFWYQCIIWVVCFALFCFYYIQLNECIPIEMS